MTNKVEVLKNTKEHLRSYPILLSQCHESALTYATCVIRKVNLEKNNCQSEFNNFKLCLMKNIVKGQAKV